MSDDHSRLARLEEGMKNICRSLDEMKDAAEKRADTLSAVLVQVRHTNGRVTNLERDRDEYENSLKDVQKRLWLMTGLLFGSGVLGGAAGMEILKAFIK